MEDLNSYRVFQLQAYIVGCITVIGPSPVEIISSVRKTDQWAAEIQQNFQEELGEAHRENDTLICSILESDETRLASVCFSHVSNVRWRKSWQYGLSESYKNSVLSQSRINTSPNDTILTAGGSHLFLIENCYRKKTPWKMGIASSLAQPGDLVCWISGIERAILVRDILPAETWEGTWQVFGTALFTRDFHLNDKKRPAPDFSWFKDEERVDIKVDAATIYILLA
jgi:hypothetical protein